MLTGKQRELRERDELFLKVARDMLLNDGYEALTIGRVAKETGFSKGTIYQRFGSKAEVVVALGIRGREHLFNTVHRALEYEGGTRERMAALGVALEQYSLLFPGDMRIIKIIDAETILENVPEEQQKRMAEYDIRIFETLMAVIQQAMAEGDLVLTGDATPQGLCFALWCMVDGGFAALIGAAPLEQMDLPQPMRAIAQAGHRLLDGYGWRPLSTETDYEETARKASAVLFGEDKAAVSPPA